MTRDTTAIYGHLTGDMLPSVTLVWCLLLLASGGEVECYASKPKLPQQLRRIGRFFGARSVYYPNSDATFQSCRLRLTREGDIETNPGPTQDITVLSQNDQLTERVTATRPPRPRPAAVEFPAPARPASLPEATADPDRLPAADRGTPRPTRCGVRSRRRGTRGGRIWRVGDKTDQLYIAQLNLQSVKGTVPAPKRSSNLLKRLRKIFAMPVRPRSVTEIRYNIIFPP